MYRVHNTDTQYRYIIQSIQYRVHNTEYTIQSTQDRVHNTEYTIQRIQYRVHKTEYTIQSTQYRVHGVFFIKIQHAEYIIQGPGSRLLVAAFGSADIDAA